MDSYDSNYLIEKAFKQALANVLFENNIVIADSDITDVRKEFSDNSKLKLLVKRNMHKYEKR